jgi:hypothetical protein
MDIGASYDEVLEVLKKLPPAQVAEVYDFARFLEAHRNQGGQIEDAAARATFLSTFGVWQDDRSAEEIIAFIYGHRSVSNDERTW